MDPYAVIETGGKQYRVQKGDIINVEKLDNAEGKKISVGTVLAVSDGKELKVGAPVLKGAKVMAKVVDHHRGDKVVAFKKKRRKGYKRKVGHRQSLTQLQVEEITG